jgi:hypothetical protein
MKHPLSRVLITAVGTVFFGLRPPTPADAADPGIDFFEQRIRPVLVEHCYECHSAAKKKQGGLLLDSRAGMRKGGDTAPAVVPAKPDESLVLSALRYDDFEMPPKGKLPANVIRDFERWIRTGAPDPREGEVATVEANSPSVEEGRSFWAFQPVRSPTAPVVKDTLWPRSDIDRFILARIEEHGLSPAADTSPELLFRRLMFDLIGLPPTPDEVDRFLANVKEDRQKAIETAVDRLLDSPHFGERWARHWLDVVRFAESSGAGRTRIFEHAWRYRDYVVASFNKDKPFDRFTVEQLAGDLLSADSLEESKANLTATSFLAIAPTNYELQDKLLLDMDVIDEQLTTTGKAFLGLTIGCARCHDHKFDPIPTRDYYALAGIFRSTKSLNHANVSNPILRELPISESQQKLFDDYAEKLVPVQREIRSLQAKLKKLTLLLAKKPDPNASPEARIKVEDAKAAAASEKASIDEQLKLLRQRQRDIEKDAPPDVPVVMSVEEGKTEDCHVAIRGNVHNPGTKVPRGFLSVVPIESVAKIDEGGSGRLELARWIARPDNTLTARVFVNRVWHWLFNAGLVRSVDNFGRMGELPSHPELLDHLATSFVEEGWSVKKLIRQIVLSRTYQLSSETSPEARKLDPENRLLSHAPRKRLDAESIRDSILAISGQLDLTTGGPTIKPGSKSEFGYTFNDPSLDGRRRSLYVPVFRNTLLDLFEVFDFADPNLVVGRRSSSTLPTQALYLMNSPWVTGQSRHAASRVLELASSQQARIEYAHRLFLGRHPRPAERQLAESFLSEAKSDEERLAAWSQICQALYSSLDFRYVR